MFSIPTPTYQIQAFFPNLYLKNSMNNRIQVDGIYTDFSKPFDNVDHNILLGELGKVGVADSRLKWVESYLTNKKFIVCINGA